MHMSLYTFSVFTRVSLVKEYCVMSLLLNLSLCYYVKSKFISNQLHILFTCEITTATGWQPNCS